MNGASNRSGGAGQTGFTLIEILVALLVFAFGILGLVGLQANAIRFSTDAQQRADATFLADQLLGRMLISDRATAAAFAHYPNGTTMCAPTGSASTNAVVTEWLGEVQRVLNGAPEDQQIVIDAATGQVTVRMCWTSGANGAPHQLIVSNQVQWQ